MFYSSQEFRSRYRMYSYEAMRGIHWWLTGRDHTDSLGRSTVKRISAEQLAQGDYADSRTPSRESAITDSLPEKHPDAARVGDSSADSGRILKLFDMLPEPDADKHEVDDNHEPRD